MTILILYYFPFNIDNEGIIFNTTEEYETFVYKVDTRLRIFNHMKSSEVHSFILNSDRYTKLISTNNDIMVSLHRKISLVSPDIIYCPAPESLPKDLIVQLKLEFPKTKWMVYYGGRVSTRIKYTLNYYDTIITGWKKFYDYLITLELPAKYLPHYYDNYLAEYITSQNLPHIYDLTFAGSVSFGGNEFNVRRHYLEELIKHRLIEIFTHIPITQTKNINYLIIKLKKLLYNIAQSDTIYSRFPYVRRYNSLNFSPDTSVFISNKISNVANKPVYGKNLYTLLNQSKMSFNSYGYINACDGNVGRQAGNIRMFEITGNNCCLITEYAENISEFFIPDDEVVTFKSASELISKVNYLLNNPRERERIANNGYLKSSSKHTYTHRIPVLNKILDDCNKL